MNRSNAADLPKAKTPQERQHIIELASKQKSEYNNPCVKEQELSFNCLEKNNYDRTACEPAFANYQMCQKFWSKVKRDRRINGIRPELPWPEDRPAIKEAYKKKWNL